MKGAKKRMEIDVKKLLRRKKLKGAEVGRIFIINCANDYNKNLTGIDEGIIPKDQIDKLVDKVVDSEEIEVYNKYVDLQSWIVKNYITASGHEQQAQLAIEKIKNLLQAVDASEKIRAFFNEKNISGSDELIKRLNNFTLESFLKNEKEAWGDVRISKAYYSVLERSLYFMNGFNSTLDLITEYYDLGAIEVYKSRIDWFENTLKIFNERIDLELQYLGENHFNLYNEIEEVEKETKLQSKKIKAFNEIFRKIDLKSYTTPESHLVKARRLIKTGKGFDKTPELINLMAEYSMVRSD